MSEKQLEQLQAKGIRWNTIMSILIFLVQFVGLYFLNKVISPVEFGKATTAIGFFMIFFVFSSISFDVVAIREEFFSEKDYSGLFYFTAIVNFFLFLLLFFVIPLINIEVIQYSKHYVKAFSFIFLFNTLNVIPTTIMFRELMFDRISSLNLVSKLFTLSLALYFAYKGKFFLSLFSLYGGIYIVYCLVKIFAVKWKIPKFMGWSFITEKFGIALSFTFHRLLTSLSKSLDSILIGQTYGEQPVAEYYKSLGFKNLPITHVVGPIGQVLLSTFSKSQSSEESLTYFFFRGQKLLAFLLIPVYLLLFLMAKPFASIYFSEDATNWNIPVIAQLLQVFALCGLFALFNPIFYNFFQITKSKSKINQIVVLQRSIFILFILLSFKFGLVYIALGKLISEIISFLINLYYSDLDFKKEDVRQFFTFLFRVFLATSFSLLLAYFVYFRSSISMNQILHFLLACIISGVGYLFFSYFLNREGFRIFFDVFVPSKKI